ncbi:enoyl-CoA hydratase [Sporosarcina sp. P3]|uniref:enoyl-CoA hydratase-related protein n=1 Tax=Sporosarcina sp. P3 TaxID=2048245 RepID=UPI000C1693E2|nr:enoyl-CoA hydratase-related protein [Sporosarcina sp. P3]PID20176.1 enoyl-CoA hydratase [Sporosarcina sp. P3]
MNNEDMFIEKKGTIATLSFNRVQKRNALNLNTWKLIPSLLKRLEDDDEIKVVILRGKDSTAFAAGADISEFDEFLKDENALNDFDLSVEKAEAALQNFPKPIIAMIQNYCIGGGCQVALACDMRFTSDNGVFGITPARLGVIYGLNATKNLVDTVGPSRAKDILFSGRFLHAEEALRIGLVDKVYPDDEIIVKTYEYANLLASKAQKSIKGSKKIIKIILDDSTMNKSEVDSLMKDAYESKDFKEGYTSFIEKRTPNFIDI